MQDWNKLYLYVDGTLLNKSDGKLASTVVNGHNQVSGNAALNAGITNGKRVSLHYRCDKIIFEMHYGIEVYAPNIKHLDGNCLNDRVDNLHLPELDSHPLDCKELKQFLLKPRLHYSERLGTTTHTIAFGGIVREASFLSKFALGRKCVVRGNPKVEFKNLNWLMAGREIPRGFQLNQKDGDYRRCDVDNLELVPVGTPLPPMISMHTDWFVKNGILYNRVARRAVLCSERRIWVDYGNDNPLLTYTAIMPSLTDLEPYDHCQRGLFPYPFSVVPLSSTEAILSEDLILHLTGKVMFTVYSYTSGILDTFHKEVIAFNKLLLEGYEDES